MSILLSKFSHNIEDKTFSADISDLGPEPFEQIYPDACDTGLVLTASHSGLESRWFIDSTGFKLADDHAVGAWVFKPTPETLRKLPVLNGYTAMVFND